MNADGRAPNGPAPQPPGSSRPARLYLAHSEPLFFAHRGGSKLAPENTLPAFEQGLAFGADALELDIQTTREGELVVIHDSTLDRTTNGTGLVASCSLDEVRGLDAGYRFTPDGGKSFPFRGRGITVPTVREVFERFPRTRVNIDLKESSPAREERLWALIRELGAEDRVLVASGDLHEPIVRFRRISGGRVASSASATEVRTFVLASAARVAWRLRPAYDALQVPPSYRGVPIVTRRNVEAAHALGIQVHVWTIDTREEMERLLRLGVDGLMTDRPDLLAQVLGRPRT
jgi:glycerophosphoryl diester phosphodiesterase